MVNRVENVKGKDDNIVELEKKFDLVTEYSNILAPLTAKCKECGYEDTKVARTFLRSGCTNCQKLRRKEINLKKLHAEDEEYLDRINEDLEDTDKFVIHKYRTSRKDTLELTHLNCGNTQKITNRYVKAICEECHTDRLIDSDWYREMYDEMGINGYEILGVEYGDYSKTRARTTTVEILHKECGQTYTRNSATLRYAPDGYFCPICTEGKRLGEINEHTVNTTIKSTLGDDYEYYSGFKDSVSPFKVKHTKCGTIYTKRLSSIRVGSGKCPVCKRSGKEITHNVKIKRYGVKNATGRRK